MGSLSVGQVIEAVVETVKPYGVFVRLKDHSLGYIRCRELDLDEDVDPFQLVRAGESITAKVIALGEGGKNTELSRRATLGDPWPKFLHDFSAGSTIRGEVQALNPSGVYVHLMPGISGFIPVKELATWRVEKPEDLLQIGDRVEAVITRIDGAPASARHQVDLSIRKRIEQRDGAAEILGSLQSTLDREMRNLPLESIQVEEHPPAINDKIIQKIGRILVVDDHEEVRVPLSNWFEGLGFVVDQAARYAEVLALVKEKEYSLLVADLNLAEDNALDMIRKLKEMGTRAHFCIMSSPGMLFSRAEEIENEEISMVFAKPLDMNEIEGFLVRFGQEKPITPWQAKYNHPSDRQPLLAGFSQEVEQAQSHNLRLKRILQEVTDGIGARAGAIFAFDSSQNATLAVLAWAGKESFNPSAVYQLDDSPVGDVIRTGEPLVENRVMKVSKARFKKLLGLLPFESCMGIPVQVGGEVHHAAFFFSHKPDAFPAFRRRDAQAGAYLMAAVLEEELLEQRLQSIQPKIITGELASSFGHEISNKISGLELTLRNLLSTRQEKIDIQAVLQNIFTLVQDTKRTVEVFQQQTRPVQENVDIDVNAVLQRCEALLFSSVDRSMAQSLVVNVDLCPDLPKVYGNSIAMQQVFFNLMLNAVQQMKLKAERYQWTGKRILEIRSIYNAASEKIEIRFSDSGPGIHYKWWEKIFQPGFTTRGGSGLGLFIARSFVQSFKANIRVEESYIPLGTTFLMEIPISK